MSLAWKSALVLLMMVTVGVLMVVARRRNYDGVRRHYTTRRMRVPRARPPEVGPEAPPEPDGDAPTERQPREPRK